MTDSFDPHHVFAESEPRGEASAADRAGQGAEAAGLPAACECGNNGPSDAALRRTLRISNSRGLHARAAAKLVTMAERYSSCVSVSRNGQVVPACSLMGLMMLGAGKGSEIEVAAEGWDAKEALEAIAGLIEAGFHED